jgi:hypothetical protein
VHLKLNALAAKRPGAFPALEKAVLVFTLGFLAENLDVRLHLLVLHK